MESARQDVHTALATGAGHISAYHLTMEPNTPFGHTPPSGLPHDDAAQDIEDAVHQALADAGFTHYETSAFARAGQACRHNLNYWQFGDYLNIGAGAHGKFPTPPISSAPPTPPRPQRLSGRHAGQAGRGHRAQTHCRRRFGV